LTVQRSLVALLLALALPVPALAQAATPAAAPAAPASAAASAPAAAPVDDDYRYDAAGRRDPFISLVARGTEAPRGASGIDGLSGLGITELSVRGVLKNPTGYVAIVQGPDNKTYLAMRGDRLLDGSIRSIGPDGLVLVQEVTDPLSPVKQREVRKGLHGTDEGK
jgi:Tfp pilus assembly protein PilP